MQRAVPKAAFHDRDRAKTVKCSSASLFIVLTARVHDTDAITMRINEACDAHGNVQPSRSGRFTNCLRTLTKEFKESTSVAVNLASLSPVSSDSNRYPD